MGVVPASVWDLPGPGIEPVFLHWQADSLPLSYLGHPKVNMTYYKIRSMTFLKLDFDFLHLVFRA